MKEVEKIKELIDTKEIISFDIFDTLILRNVEKPTDIFKILSKEIEQKYNITTFFDDRIKAEQQSRINQKNYESNLDRIYNFLEQKYSKYKEEIKQREVELELEFITCNKFMKEIYDYAINKNKKVLLISDMYLPKEIIIRLLKKCDYENVNLYISNEIYESKHIGGLYDYVKRIENIDYKNWLHIGDNKHSDVFIPNSKGITAYHYKNVFERVDRKNQSNSIELSIIRGIQNNYLLQNENLEYWETFGIKYISQIYYGFVNWLVKLTKKEEKIYFFSRDGYIVKKIYEIFKDKLDLKPELKYLYTSRITYQIPVSIFNDKESALKAITDRNVQFGHYITLKEIFNILELDIDKYTDELNAFGFTSISKKIEDNEIHNLKKFLSHIYEDIKENFREKINVLEEYLKQEEISKNSCIVDVGWRCSIQKSITDLLGIPLKGYYFGTNQYVYPEQRFETYGYIMDNGNSGEIGKFILDNIMMFELIFSAPEGTLLTLKKEKNKIIPVLEESNQIEKNISVFQKSALEIVKKYLEYYKYLINVNYDEVLIDYRDFINYRDFDDIIAFKDMKNDVGYTQEKKEYVKTYSEKEIVNNYNEFIKEISQSLWKWAYNIKGINNAIDYEDFKNKLFEIKLANEKNNININYIKKAIKNPKKAINVIKYKLNNIFNNRKNNHK